MTDDQAYRLLLDECGVLRAEIATQQGMVQVALDDANRYSALLAAAQERVRELEGFVGDRDSLRVRVENIEREKSELRRDARSLGAELSETQDALAKSDKSEREQRTRAEQAERELAGSKRLAQANYDSWQDCVSHLAEARRVVEAVRDKVVEGDLAETKAALERAERGWANEQALHALQREVSETRLRNEALRASERDAAVRERDEARETLKRVRSLLPDALDLRNDKRIPIETKRALADLLEPRREGE